MHSEREEFIHRVLKTKEEERRTMDMEGGKLITEEGCERFCARTDGLID